MGGFSEDDWQTFLITMLVVLFQPVGLYYSMWTNKANREMWRNWFDASCFNVMTVWIIPGAFMVVHGCMWAAWFLFLRSKEGLGDKYDAINALVLGTIIVMKAWGWIVFNYKFLGRWLMGSFLVWGASVAAWGMMWAYLPNPNAAPTANVYVAWLWLPVVLWSTALFFQGIGLYFPNTKILGMNLDAGVGAAAAGVKVNL